VVFNVILVALVVLVVFEIFKETSNEFTAKFPMISTVDITRKYPLRGYILGSGAFGSDIWNNFY